MSWREAPLYVEAHQLACWVLERAASWREREEALLAPPTAAAACELVVAVSLGLTFPRTRGRHLEEADASIVRLRTLLRLAESLGLLSGGGLRFAAGRLQVIGRMVGGWRKRQRARLAEAAGRQQLRGDGPPAATNA